MCLCVHVCADVYLCVSVCMCVGVSVFIYMWNVVILQPVRLSYSTDNEQMNDKIHLIDSTRNT